MGDKAGPIQNAQLAGLSARSNLRWGFPYLGYLFLVRIIRIMVRTWGCIWEVSYSGTLPDSPVLLVLNL